MGYATIHSLSMFHIRSLLPGFIKTKINKVSPDLAYKGSGTLTLPKKMVEW